MKKRDVIRTVIGVDFGTQSARAVLVDTQNGRILASYSTAYMKNGKPIPDWGCGEELISAAVYETALWELLGNVIPEELRQTVCGICVDATSLTLVPLASDGRALSDLPGFDEEPHARVKLWKYHRAQEKADEALMFARKLEEPFLQRTGGYLSCEWMLPKLLEIRDEAPQIYEVMNLALDLCEFLTFRLTGRLVRSTGSMCYKGLWAEDIGFPSQHFLDGLRRGFHEEYCRLLRGEIRKPGQAAGYLLPEIGKKLGLSKEVTVAVGVLDGHTSLAALGALEKGDAALVVGTSNVLTVQSDKLKPISGICGIAQDGMVPGMCGIDSGQNCTGNMIEWFMNNMVGCDVWKASEQRGLSPHQILAERIHSTWDNRVTVTDWWSGSRNVPCNLKLKGGIAGVDLTTRSENIYLALLQSIVCGTKVILDSLSIQGIPVKHLRITGGIAKKNPLLMQEYANILGKAVSVGETKEGPAVGAAIYAAVAAGCYSSLQEAYGHMGISKYTVYEPDEVHRGAYEKLYCRNMELRNFLSDL